SVESSSAGRPISAGSDLLSAAPLEPPFPQSAISPGQELLDGRLLGHEVLGVGSAGVVYRVDDRRLGRPVALKTLRNFDADRLYQLKREFRTLAKFSHPNLVQLYELGASGDLWFLLMELVDGVELRQGF